LVFTYAGGRITFRPSGTEPKLKFYVQTTGGADAQSEAEEIGETVYEELTRMMGRDLQTAFAALPDVISLDSKVELQDKVLPELRRLLAAADQEPGFIGDWLTQRVNALIVGESALDIVAPALRVTAKTWNEREAQQLQAVLSSLGK
jgi:hypothetical protein